MKIKLFCVMPVILLFPPWGVKNNDKSPKIQGWGTLVGTVTALVSGNINVLFNSNTAFGLQSRGNAAAGEFGLMQLQEASKRGDDNLSIDFQI